MYSVSQILGHIVGARFFFWGVILPFFAAPTLREGYRVAVKYSKTSWDTASWDTDLDGTLF